ncbi:hypothetical protein THAOC_17947, partial [Thalassiosira oceanica]
MPLVAAPYTGNVADMSPTCRQDMTFRRDWRRQGGCRRHSGGCRVSAVADHEEERNRDTAASPGRKRFPRTPTADEVSVATGAGKLALRSLFASMNADADDDDSLLLTIPDAAGGGSSDGVEETSRAGDDETPGADFSSIRDDDGTASVYSGTGKRALGFLHAQQWQSTTDTQWQSTTDTCGHLIFHRSTPLFRKNLSDPLAYTGNVADMSPTCRQDMTFRRDWRRQGGCRRHSGGCRVSAAVGKPRTYVIDTVDAGHAVSCPTATLSRVSFPKAWRRKRALRSLLGAMDGGSDGDDEPRPIKRRSGTGTRP